MQKNGGRKINTNPAPLPSIRDGDFNKGGGESPPLKMSRAKQYIDPTRLSNLHLNIIRTQRTRNNSK